MTKLAMGPRCGPIAFLPSFPIFLEPFPARGPSVYGVFLSFKSTPNKEITGCVNNPEADAVKKSEGGTKVEQEPLTNVSKI